MALTIHFSAHSIRFRILLVVALAIGLGLWTNLCSGMERSSCYTNQPKIDNCDVQTSRIPMNPCSVMPKTNHYAPVMAYAHGETVHFSGSRLQATVSKPSCGSAPVIKQTGVACYLGRSDKVAPYFAAQKCPTAAVFISVPSVQTRDNCK